MSDQIIGLHDWFATPPGRYLLAWERAQLDLAVANIFGYHALQLGLAELDALAANRMPHRWLATQTPVPGAAIVTDFSALPFPAHSLDLVVLPHALESTADPHLVLREAERVLIPEGQLVISGFNPLSLWRMRQLFARKGAGAPWDERFIGLLRLKDWLHLLGFELNGGRFGCYAPPIENPVWLSRFSFMEKAGARWWPIMGGVYVVRAVKRVHGMRLIAPAWRKERARRRALAAVPQRNGHAASRSSTVRNTQRRNVDG